MAVGGFEEGGAGDEGVGSGGLAKGRGFEIDAAVDFEPEVQVLFAAPVGELLDFREAIVPEALSAETGLDGHDEDEVDLGEEMFDGVGGGGGVDDDAVLAAEFADARQGAAVVVVGFDVDADEIGAGFGKGFDVAVGFVEHEVSVKEELRNVRAERGEGLGAEGEVGDEVTVHDVEVQPRDAEGGNLSRGFGKVGVVAGKEGGCEDGHGGDGRRLESGE